MIKYNKVQYSKLLIVLFLPIIVFVICSYYYQIGSKPLPLMSTILIIAVLLIGLLFFYKLTIIIDTKNITARFGIGLLKKTIPINEINLNTIEKVSFSALVGIGLRLTSKGWLWNVKVGNAIYFKTKKNKIFLVGTDDFETIVKHIS